MCALFHLLCFALFFSLFHKESLHHLTRKFRWFIFGVWLKQKAQGDVFEVGVFFKSPTRNLHDEMDMVRLPAFKVVLLFSFGEIGRVLVRGPQ